MLAMLLTNSFGRQVSAQPEPVPGILTVAADGEGGGQQHEGHQSAMRASASDGLMPHEELRILNVIRPPEGFVGNIAYDQQSGRMWLISLGPPANTKGPSTLYEVDPSSGKVLAQARMPFLGEFGSPAYIEGHLHIAISHESKLYKVAVGEGASFGKIVKTLALPTLNDLNVIDDEVYRFPFVEFSGIAASLDNNLLLHASDVGEFITIDKETGKILNRVKTLRGLGGIAGYKDSAGEFFLLGNYNPAEAMLKREMRRFLFRAAHGVVPISNRTYDDRTITWVLLDTKTGSPLAALERLNSSAIAGTISLAKHEAMPQTLYGKFTFFIRGDESILTMEWVPSRKPL